MAKKPVKVSLIGPDRISQRFDYQASTAVYRDMDDFLADVVAIEVVISLWYLNDLAYWVHRDSKGSMFPQILLDFR